MHYPKGTKLLEIVDRFEVCWGFPQVASAIDRTHVPVIKPQDNPSDYYNWKGSYSIIMQAVVDYRGLFLDTYIGWPGKVHVARVFSNSCIYRKGREGILLPNWKRQINEVEVCNLIYVAVESKFILFIGTPINPWRSSLPSATMAYETICCHPTHNIGTK